MKHLIFFVCLISALLLSTGCSIIGIAIGASTETKEVYYENIKNGSPKFKSLELIDGDSVKIYTIDGDSCNGIIISSEKILIDNYTQELINTFKDKIYFPKQYDTLWANVAGNIVYYEFLGFRNKNIILRKIKSDNKVTISLLMPYLLAEKDNQIIFNEQQANEIYKSKNLKFIHFEDYLKLMELYNEKIITIRNRNGEKIIHKRNISQIIVPYRKNYALEGFLVGLGIDAFIVIQWLLSNPLY